MKRVSFFLGWIFLLIVAVSAQDKIVKLKIVETSDIHGNYYPYDFILRHEAGGSLARIHAFVQKEREVYKDNLLIVYVEGKRCFIDAADAVSFTKMQVNEILCLSGIEQGIHDKLWILLSGIIWDFIFTSHKEPGESYIYNKV